MRYLALDPGAKCGWAVLEDGAYVAGGTRVARQKTKDHVGKRWNDFRLWVAQLMREQAADALVIEDVSRHKGTKAAHAYGFYRYTAEAEASAIALPVIALPVGMWKKAATGSGNADKDKIGETMRAAYPHVVFESDDHSDAVAMATVAARAR